VYEFLLCIYKFDSEGAGYYSNCAPIAPLTSCLDRENIDILHQRSVQLCSPILSKVAEMRSRNPATFVQEPVLDFNSLRYTLPQDCLPKLIHAKMESQQHLNELDSCEEQKESTAALIGTC
jgi:hypothetical protein